MSGGHAGGDDSIQRTTDNRQLTTLVIDLTRLNGERFVLNAELIQYVEALPDTYITLTTGERVVVQQSMQEVVSRAVDYQRSKWLIPPAPPVRR